MRLSLFVRGVRHASSRAAGSAKSPPQPKTFTLTNAAFRAGESGPALKAVITNYGAIVQQLHVPDRDGTMADVVLGKDNIADYDVAGKKSPYFGAICGRFSNRIRNGRFAIDGHKYQLNCNEGGKHHLHGGNKGWDSQLWYVVSHSDDQLVLKYHSADGDEKYPGAVEAKATFHTADDGTLQIVMEATTNKPTVINMTHHGYFNLRGHDMGDLGQHCLRLNAEHYTKVDEELIPTGEMGSCLTDFNLGPDEIPTFTQVFTGLAAKGGNGVDHNFVLRRPKTTKPQELTAAATLYDPVSGRIMRVSTNQPGLQIYTANGDFRFDGKNGAKYQTHAGVCFETQNFPDAVNHPKFPKAVLRPGEHYKHVVHYRFTNDEKEQAVLSL